MSNTGIRGFYLLTEAIEQQLLADVNVNTVTTGDIYDIDLAKQSIFPLCHIIINNVTAQENVLTFNVSVLAMDIVDESKEETTDILKEEIKITSAMIQDGTEADAMLDELNAKLVELQNRKPKTTVIVKEVEVKKRR